MPSSAHCSRCACRSPFDPYDIHVLGGLSESGAADILREDVRDIVGSYDFDQPDLFAADLVSDPQVRYIQVTDLAKRYLQRPWRRCAR